MAKSKKARKDHGASHDNLARNHGFIPFSNLPANEYDHGDGGAHKQADDGGRAPCAALAAPLHSQQKHEDGGDEDDTTDKVKTENALGDGLLIVSWWPKKENDDGKRNGNEGDIDPVSMSVTANVTFMTNIITRSTSAMSVVP